MDDNTVESKICFKCKGNSQPLTNFYSHSQTKDGRLGKCKSCTKKDVSSNYLDRIDYYKKYDRNRQRSAERRKKKVVYLRTFRRNHRGFSAAHDSKRRARLKQAMPLWVDFCEIKNIYSNCPENMVVDHIVPLVNSKVCGLHVPWNLQYLTMIDNSIKGNKYD